jgi:hypothetical protein
MTTAFVKGTPPAENFAAFDHLKNRIPLTEGVASASAPVNDQEKAWRKTKVAMFAGRKTTPDAEDPDTLSHLNWYEATGFTRPYPGETKVRAPSEFKNRLARQKPDSDSDGD